MTHSATQYTNAWHASVRAHTHTHTHTHTSSTPSPEPDRLKLITAIALSTPLASPWLHWAGRAATRYGYGAGSPAVEMLGHWSFGWG
jgi:hypothetical protein